MWGLICGDATVRRVGTAPRSSWETNTFAVAYRAASAINVRWYSERAEKSFRSKAPVMTMGRRTNRASATGTAA